MRVNANQYITRQPNMTRIRYIHARSPHSEQAKERIFVVVYDGPGIAYVQASGTTSAKEI
jgi:hypothetical protein